jgi:hypothetical protein
MEYVVFPIKLASLFKCQDVRRFFHHTNDFISPLGIRTNLTNGRLTESATLNTTMKFFSSVSQGL